MLLRIYLSYDKSLQKEAMLVVSLIDIIIFTPVFLINFTEQFLNK